MIDASSGDAVVVVVDKAVDIGDGGDAATADGAAAAAREVDY